MVPGAKGAKGVGQKGKPATKPPNNGVIKGNVITLRSKGVIRTKARAARAMQQHKWQAFNAASTCR